MFLADNAKTNGLKINMQIPSITRQIPVGKSINCRDENSKLILQ